MELPFIGFVFAFMAGTMNAWSLANASTFSTVQSGNVVSVGYYLVQKEWDKLAFPFGAVLSFGLGSAACGVLMTVRRRQGRSFTGSVLTAKAIVLFVLGVLAITLVDTGQENGGMLDLTVDHSAVAYGIAFGISFVAGAQGNAFHKNHGMLYGNIAVTFVVQMAFNFLVQSRFQKGEVNGASNLEWAGIYFLVLLGFAGGGAAGFLADAVLNGASIFIPAIIAAVLVVVSRRTHSRHIDPTPGGSFV